MKFYHYFSLFLVLFMVGEASSFQQTCKYPLISHKDVSWKTSPARDVSFKNIASSSYSTALWKNSVYRNPTNNYKFRADVMTHHRIFPVGQLQETIKKQPSIDILNGLTSLASSMALATLRNEVVGAAKYIGNATTSIGATLFCLLFF